MVVLVFVIGAVILPLNAYAYIDPGSGSLILQIVFGLLVGFVVAGKMFWRRFLDFFSWLKSKRR